MSAHELTAEAADRRTAGVDQAAAHAVLHHFAPSNRVMRPGSFTRGLVDTIARADPMNQARLRTAFPGLVDGVVLAQGRSDGIARLRAIAGVDDDTPVAVHHLVVLSSFGNLYLFCRQCQREEPVGHEYPEAGVPAAVVAAALEAWEHTR